MKPVSNYKVQIEPAKKDDHYHIKFKAGSGQIDCVMERSSIRHIIGMFDEAIGTGLEYDDDLI